MYHEYTKEQIIIGLSHYKFHAENQVKEMLNLYEDEVKKYKQNRKTRQRRKDFDELTETVKEACQHADNIVNAVDKLIENIQNSVDVEYIPLTESEVIVVRDYLNT